MIVAIHQPNFIPWLGYFYKIAKADVFVLLDDVQYTKNSFINRNRIKTPQGKLWLTIPVIHSGQFGQLINEVKIQNPGRSLNKIIKSIESNYIKAPFFDEVFNIVETGLIQTDNLAEINEAMIVEILGYLGVGTRIIRSSDLAINETNSSHRLVKICEVLGAKTYLSGFGSSNYQENEVFVKAGIKSEVYDFIHPEYTQLWGEFTHSLSILDVLFNLRDTKLKKLLGV